MTLRAGTRLQSLGTSVLCCVVVLIQCQALKGSDCWSTQVLQCMETFYWYHAAGLNVDHGLHTVNQWAVAVSAQVKVPILQKMVEIQLYSQLNP
jgi:hypothetical protein